jgi:hypothetical protein
MSKKISTYKMCYSIYYLRIHSHSYRLKQLTTNTTACMLNHVTIRAKQNKVGKMVTSTIALPDYMMNLKTMVTSTQTAHNITLFDSGAYGWNRLHITLLPNSLCIVRSLLPLLYYDISCLFVNSIVICIYYIND